MTLPTPAVLGLNSSRAGLDLAELGWDDPSDPTNLDLLWALAGSGDPGLALNTLMRVVGALTDDAERAAFLDQLREDQDFRIRVMALLGGSTALGDHLAANPDLWRELTSPLPDRTEMMRTMLGAVGAQPAGEAQVPDGDDAAADPDPAVEDLTKAGTYRAAAAGPEAEKALRRTYRTLIMRIAAYDLAGTYPTTKRHPGGEEISFRTVSTLLTDLADAGLTAALAVAVRQVYDDAPLDTRLVVMALGKCGAQELNYISDVDVIFVAEPASPRATRLASEFSRLGTRAFFEVDPNLRPEGRSGALVRTLESHVTYYQRWAETWEFQALLKARTQTGYLPLGRAYREALAPMVWQASQRESFVDDVQAMRRRVLANVPTDQKRRELKLGPGGLRDVEFAVQLLQLVHGRSDESLRVLPTITALEALIAGGYIGRDDGHGLIDAYGFLRLLEHRLQLMRLRRTHLLPEPDDDTHLNWLARVSGFASQDGQSATQLLNVALRRVRMFVAELHSRLFYRPLLHSVVSFSVDTLKLTPEAAKLQLGALGYKFPDRAFEHLSALASGASRKARIQAMLLPTLMEWLSQTADPDAGLLNYRKLSEAAYDRTWFLRMLRDEGVVGQRLMHILGTSPFAADLIIATPDFVKMLGDGATGPKLIATGSQTVSKSLVAAAARHSDPDKAISVARSLRRSELARIASADLLGMLDVPTVCRSLSAVWNAVLEAGLRAEIAYNLKTNNLAAPPARIGVIGMGRLGGAELGYGSDADVMFVCQPAEGVTEAEAVSWSIGVCDAMRGRLSKPSGDPPLDVDLGLRPEGRSGAVVRTIDSYRRYYEQWGEVWETQALLRASYVAGDKDVCIEFLHMIDKIRYPDGGISQSDIRSVRRMKARVDNERLPRGADRNTHTKLGRGALTDIEWTVQLLTMMHAHQYPALHNTSTLETLDVLSAEGILSAEDTEILRTAWLTATKARNALVLVRGKRTDQLPQPGHALVPVAGAAGWDPNHSQDFLEDYLRATRRARNVVDEVFWGEQTSEP